MLWEIEILLFGGVGGAERSLILCHLLCSGLLVFRFFFSTSLFVFA